MTIIARALKPRVFSKVHPEKREVCSISCFVGPKGVASDLKVVQQDVVVQRNLKKRQVHEEKNTPLRNLYCHCFTQHRHHFLGAS